MLSENVPLYPREEHMLGESGTRCLITLSETLEQHAPNKSHIKVCRATKRSTVAALRDCAKVGSIFSALHYCILLLHVRC
jgi:hypothetical protein